MKASFAMGTAILACALLSAPASAVAQSGGAFVYVVNLDIVPAKFDGFLAAAKENATASLKDPGCLGFDIAIAQDDPHHVLFYEIYDSPAALKAHEATDHFKKYQATTKDMVAKRQTQRLTAVASNGKAM